jgi:hypothetical protein
MTGSGGVAGGQNEGIFDFDSDLDFDFDGIFPALVLMQFASIGIATPEAGGQLGRSQKEQP